MRTSFFKILIIITLSSLILGACRPATPKPGEPSPVPGTEAVSSPQPSKTSPQPVKPTQPPPTETPSFTISDPGDPIPPQVVSVKPGSGQELPPGDSIEVVFDQAMDPKATTEALEVTTGKGEAVKGKISWADDRTLHFVPTAKLETGQLYFASLDAKVASAEGVSMAEPYTFEFQAAGELAISQVFPTADAQAVESQAVITVIFNRPVVPLVIAEEQANLPQPLTLTPAVAGKGEWISTSVYAFRPSGFLQSGITYTARVAAGLKDAEGASTLANDYTWQFSTAQPGIGHFRLSDRIYNPDDGLENVLLDDYFSVGFLQPMDKPSTERAVTLTGGSSAVPLTFVWSADEMGLVITPTQRLALDTSYTLRISKNAQASNGGGLSDGLEWSFTTVGPPAITRVTPSDGEVQKSYSSELRVQFASPMRINTVKDHIVITPKPKEPIEWYYNEWDWSISAWFLEPSTNYSVRFLPGMQDIYGNSIQQEKAVGFVTAAYQPSARLMMPYVTPIFREQGPEEARRFYIAYTNVSKVDLKLGRMTLENFMSIQSGKTSEYKYDIGPADLVWQETVTARKSLNQRVFEYYTPAEDDKPLTPGFYFLTLETPEIDNRRPYDDVRTLMVANTNLTLKSSHYEALAWVTDLETGEPLSGIEVQFYGRDGAIGKATSDKNGLAMLEFAEPLEDEAVYALVDSKEYFAFANNSWGAGVSLWDYGIQTDYYTRAYTAKAYVYTERPIYRPGQPVYFKGIVRIDNDLDYQLPSDATVNVQIYSYEEQIYTEELPLSDIGTFDGQFTLDAEAALGSYDIQVYLPSRFAEPVGNVSFSVAEYRKPEYQVTVTASPADLLAGQDFTALVQADYYSGGAVADARVDWTLTAQTWAFQPPDDFSGYNFRDTADDIYFYTEEYDNTRTLSDGQGITGTDGAFSVSLAGSLDEAGKDQELIFEATLTDVAQTSVSGRASVIVHRSQVYPGIRPQTYVGIAGEATGFDLAALDWDGKPLAQQALTVDIVERRWHSVQEQQPSGRVEWKSEVEEIPVTKVEAVTDSRGLAQVEFTPPAGGVYRARVTGLDDKGNAGLASAYLWVSGDKFIPWRQTNDRSFNLITDKKSYHPGETAEILIASPFEGPATALVTVERGRIRFEEVIALDTNSQVYKLRITPDLAPNAYISVVVVKGVDEFSQRPNFRMGIAEIEVSLERQSLKVELTPDRKETGPGEQVTYTVRTLDSTGKPVQAEVSLSLSDLATLSLLPPNSGPALDYFYRERSLGVWTTVGIVLDIDEYNEAIREEAQEGAAAGGGGDAGLGVVEVRQDFPDTAFWDARVQTGSSGEATVTVTLPDNLTTWRMDARAVAENNRFGQTTTDIVSTRPLLVRPQTPRFFVVGDTAILGAAVHNNTGETLTVNTLLQAEGLKITSEPGQVVTIPAGQQVLVTWGVSVLPDAQRVDLVFSAEGGRYKDASRAPQGTLDNQGLPVYRYVAPEVVGTSGQLTGGGTRVEGILLPQSMKAATGELTIRLQPSLAAAMTDGLRALGTVRYESVESIVSRFLPNVLAVQAYQLAGLDDPSLKGELDAQVQTALQRLYSWQNSDGGWGWWGDDRSDPLTSAYTLLGLVEARDAKYDVSSDVISRAVTYLSGQIEPVEKLKAPWELNRQAFLLYVLARADAPNVSGTVQLYDERRRMQIYAQAFLAGALYRIDPGDTRLNTLRSDFASSAIVSATGTHWEEADQDRWNWNSDTRTTAIVLHTLAQIDPNNQLIANAVRWLMAHRRGDSWFSIQETAWTLMGLTRWMEISGELQADYEYAVGLNGKTLASGQADSSNLREDVTVEVDIQELLQDELNRVAFAHSGGPGNLYYTAHLNVTLPVEQIQPLDRGIVVSRSYYRQDDLETPVTEAKTGDILLARLTLVAPHALHYVVVNDPLPAGLEGVDQGLETSPQQTEVPQQYTWEDMFRWGWGWWSFDHIQYRDEAVVLSASYLPAGTYVYTYLVRAGLPGTFKTIPVTASELYFPEVYGRSEGNLFTVKP